MAVANTAIDAYQAKNAIGALKGLSDATSIKDAASATSASLSVTVGSSQSKSTTTDESTNVVFSTIGGKNVTIKAIGDNSDINVIGSNISGTLSTKLISDHDINIIAAANYDEQHSTDKSSGWNAGAVISTEAVGATFGGNVGKGNADGVGTVYTNSHVGSLSSSTTINAGDTTNIIGGQITGNRVKLIASNLNIESLQDTAVYDSQQKNISGQITVGAGWVTVSGSASKSNIDANYASVNEQSGIIAGDKGYDVSVVNNTNLIGGIITSTTKAEDDKLNSFSTGTLTLSNIDNYSNYEGDSIGLSGSVGFSNPNATTKTDAIKSINTPSSTTSGTKITSTKSIGYGSDSDSQTSKTYAGINTSNITITDTEAQLATDISAEDIIAKAHTDITTYTLEANSGALANTFDAAAVQHELDVQTRVTQEFNENVTNIANALIAEKTKESRDNAIKATNSPNGLYEGKTSEEWNQEAQSWSGEKAAVANILITVLTGNSDMLQAVLVREGLRYMATEMRNEMIKNSKRFAGVVDENGKVFNNMTGDSEGVNGDGNKIGGTRWDLDLLCGADNRRCITDDNGDLKLDSQGLVQWDKDKAGVTLDEFLASPDGKKLYGATGGIQGMPGTLFGIRYDAGSWQDNLIEAYSGSHDYIGGYISGLYDQQGNAIRGMSKFESTAYNTWAVIAIPIATPFAMSELFDAQTWEIVNAALEMAQ